MNTPIAKTTPLILGTLLVILMFLYLGVVSSSAQAAAVTMVPVDATQEVTQEAASNCTVRALLTGTQIHIGPASGRSVRASLPYDVDVQVVGQAQDKSGNTWYNIHLPEVTTELDRYWVLATDVETFGNCTQVQQVSASPIIAAAQTVSYPVQTAIIDHFGSGALGYVISLPMVTRGLISNDRAKDDGLNSYPSDLYALHLSQFTTLGVNLSAYGDQTNVRSCTLDLRGFGNGFSLDQYNLDVKNGNSAAAIDAIIAGDYYFSVTIYPGDVDCTFHYMLTMNAY